MMKRKTTAYKIIQVLILAVVVILLPIVVWAQETTLTTVVPSGHLLHLELIGEGAIVVDGVTYTKSAGIQIQRHSTPSLSIELNGGSTIRAVILDGQEVTEQIQSGTFTLPAMRNDMQLSVVFETHGGISAPGDQSSIEILYLLMSLPVIGMLLCVMVYRKTRKNDK